MGKVYFENGKHIELSSCKVREFPKLYDHAIRFLQAMNEEGGMEIADEIMAAWAPSLSAEDLTLDDIWEIMLTKAGKTKRGLLETLLEVMQNAMRKGMEGFFDTPEAETAMKTALSTSANGGDDTSPA